MKTDNATPRKWFVNVWTTGRRTIESHGNGHPIAEILPQHNDVHKDNAELIVRAVNSHDALLEACKLIASKIIGGETAKDREVILKAIQQAEG